MLQPVTTLDLPKIVITELQKKGYFYVEDLLNNSEDLEKLNFNSSDINKKLQLSESLALDIWQHESERDCISICCSDIESIFENGIQCGVITELSGAPFSGKTQICMQLCVSVQLQKNCGGLNGRAVYVDTRSSICVLRFTDLVEGCNKYYKDLNLEEDDVFSNIEVYSPMSLEEFLEVIDCLQTDLKTIKNNKQIRLIIIDSLSMPILCSIEDPTKRPHYYSRVLHELHKLTLSHSVAVVITNEVITQVQSNGKPYFTAAGGQYVADYAATRVELARLSEATFAARLLKSPVLPEISVTFAITEDGIRNAT